MDREIIDFCKKGNSVKFYLGHNGSQRGDDWDDIPYEHNAGIVYDEYIQGEIVKHFDWYDRVLEPCDGESNSSYSKEDFIKRKIPCIIVVKGQYIYENDVYISYKNVLEFPDFMKIEFYFGDKIDGEK